MEEITGNHYGVRGRSNDVIDGESEGPRYIGFPLIDATRGLPMILPDAEMGIGDVGEFHGWSLWPNSLKCNHLPA